MDTKKNFHVGNLKEGKAVKKHGGLMFDFTGLFQFFVVLG